MIEEWRVIPGFEKYEISNFGRVKRINRYRNIGPVDGILNPYPIFAIRNKNRNWTKDRLGVTLTSSLNKHRPHKIHFLVTLAFLGKRPEGKEVNHKDGNRFNNYLDNLEYVTPQENKHHAEINGLQKKKRFVRPCRGCQ